MKFWLFYVTKYSNPDNYDSVLYISYDERGSRFMQDAVSEIYIFLKNILKPQNNILAARNAENSFKITGTLKLRRHMNLYVYFEVNLTNLLKISAKHEGKCDLDHIFYIFD